MSRDVFKKKKKINTHWSSLCFNFSGCIFEDSKLFSSFCFFNHRLEKYSKNIINCPIKIRTSSVRSKLCKNRSDGLNLKLKIQVTSYHLKSRSICLIKREKEDSAFSLEYKKKKNSPIFFMLCPILRACIPLISCSLSFLRFFTAQRESIYQRREYSIFSHALKVKVKEVLIIIFWEKKVLIIIYSFRVDVTHFWVGTCMMHVLKNYKQKPN